MCLGSMQRSCAPPRISPPQDMILAKIADKEAFNSNLQLLIFDEGGLVQAGTLGCMAVVRCASAV